MRWNDVTNWSATENLSKKISYDEYGGTCNILSYRSVSTVLLPYLEIVVAGHGRWQFLITASIGGTLSHYGQWRIEGTETTHWKTRRTSTELDEPTLLQSMTLDYRTPHSVRRSPTDYSLPYLFLVEAGEHLYEPLDLIRIMGISVVWLDRRCNRLGSPHLVTRVIRTTTEELQAEQSIRLL